MGTVVSVHVVGRARAGAEVEAAIEGCFAELRDIERVFSPFRPDSDISRMLRGEVGIAQADPRVRHVEHACESAEIATRGMFSAHWRGGFDPTGYVKGWAVDVAGARHLDPLLTDPGVTAVGVNAGGDLRLRTAGGSSWRWRVGIADPGRRGAVQATVEVRDGAVATSGPAERGGHIVDPRTGLATVGVRSATVIADDLATADVWATAAVVAGGDLSWVGGMPDTAGLVIADDGTIRRWIRGVEVQVVAA
ncbi:FAD:protein FMN transferase [Microbacterium hominis]|uniref:FAD:protein FMN transferase n=2 Tax=Microbacterium hominis TaxID=162426 RepID=A0A7D4Q3R0_9MICO|nr:FAD:protein FMN transferase [Microbacterium hominis]